MQGNSELFLEVWSHADDFAILGAMGSHTQGWDNVRTHLLGAPGASTSDFSFGSAASGSGSRRIAARVATLQQWLRVATASSTSINPGGEASGYER